MASALLSFMAACSNDELETVNNESQIETSGEIVGETLLSKGANLNVNMDGAAESRMGANGQFEKMDRLGLGWFNAASTSKNTTSQSYAIFDAQATAWTDVNGEAKMDKKVYANHVFQLDNVWSSFANIYQGAHFAYYPHVHADKVAEMLFEFKNNQTSNDASEQFNKGLQMSPKLLMSTKDVKDCNLELDINLYKMHNTLQFNVNSKNSPFGSDEVLKKETINSTTVSYAANNNILEDIFVTGVKLNPHALPETAYKRVAGVWVLDTEKNKANMRNENVDAPVFGLGKALEATKTGKSVAATLDKEFAKTATVSSNPMLYINLFPHTAFDANNLKSSTVTLTTRFGSFRFFNLKKVNKFLTDGFFQGDKKKGISTLANEIPVELDLATATFTPNYAISDVAEWKDAVEFANALMTAFPENKNYKNAKFTIDDEIVFTEGEMVDVNNGVAITVVESNNKKGKITIKKDGNVSISVDNIQFIKNERLSSWPKITVENGATFNVNKTYDTSTLNYGTMNIAKDAKAGTVTNYENARVNVVYGSYLALSKSTENKGQVAFEVTNETKAYQINNLIAETGNSKGYALVNTLVVNAGVKLNLAMTETSAGLDDPYNPSTGLSNSIKKLAMKSVSLEMNGGEVYHAGIKTHDEAFEVAGIVSVNGGTVTDVKVIDKGNVVVEKGTLTIDATNLPNKVGKLTQRFNALTTKNGATTQVNVEARIDDVFNEKQATLKVADGYKITYNKFNQDGTTSGQVVPNYN